MHIAIIYHEGEGMEEIIGITYARNNIKEIFDSFANGSETYIITRGSKPEAVIIPYQKYIESKELFRQIYRLKYEGAFKNSKIQFKEWLKEKGIDPGKISDKDLDWIVKELEINNKE